MTNLLRINGELIKVVVSWPVKVNGGKGRIIIRFRGLINLFKNRKVGQLYRDCPIRDPVMSQEDQENQLSLRCRKLTQGLTLKLEVLRKLHRLG